MAFRSSIAHDMLEYENAALSPCSNHIFGLSRVDYWEKIGACQNLIRYDIVRIKEVTWVEIFVFCWSQNTIC